MIDENLIFSSDDSHAAQQIEQEHRDCANRRAQNIARLLNELRNPAQIAKRITVEFERESALMKRLLAQIERMDGAAEPGTHDKLKDRWDAEVASRESNLFTRAMPYHLWVSMQATPRWSHSRNALQKALDLLEDEQRSCYSGLSGRRQSRPLKEKSQSAISKT